MPQRRNRSFTEVDVGRSTYATVLLIDSESYIRYLCRNPENCPLSRRYNKTLVITGAVMRTDFTLGLNFLPH